MNTLPSASRIVAVARRDLTRLFRARLVFWITALAALFWLAAPDLRFKPGGALLLTSELMFLAMLFMTAGVIAESLGSGAAMLDRLHGITPLESVLGSVLGIILALTPSFLVSAVLVYRVTPPSQAGPVTLMLVWTAAAVIAFVSLGVLLGVLLPSAGNAIVLAPLVLGGMAPPVALPVQGLPPAVASGLRAVWSVLPLQFQVEAIESALIMGTGPVRLPPVVIIVSIPLYLSLAAVMLRRLQPATRWKQ